MSSTDLSKVPVQYIGAIRSVLRLRKVEPSIITDQDMRSVYAAWMTGGTIADAADKVLANR
jgi:hypothetical protein